jgi:hypothetical protein
MPAIYQPALKELGLGTNGNGDNGNYGWLPLGVLVAIGVGAYFIHRSSKRDEEYAEYARRGWTENRGRRASGTGEDGLPDFAPATVKTVFRKMMQSAIRQQDEHGTGPWSIYWSKGKDGEWAVGDNFDIKGFLVLKPDGRWYYRWHWGDRRFKSSGAAYRRAARFFDDIGEYM